MIFSPNFKLKDSTKNILIVILLFIVGFAIYANSFPNEMFWDDDDFILKNRYIKDWHYWPHYFTENVVAGNYLLSNYWRPVLLLLFSLEWHLWQAWAPGYHIVSTFFHAIDSVLLFIFLILITKDRWLASLTSLTFLVHPIQTEAVVYANAISDSLAAFFIFLSLIFYVKSRTVESANGKKSTMLFYLLSWIMYPLGLMSKEVAFVLPGYIAALELTVLNTDTFFPKKLKTISLRLLPFLILAGIYLYLRSTSLNFVNTFNFYNEANILTSHFLVRLFTFFRVMSVYFGLLFFPIDLHVERSVSLATSLFSASVLFGAALFFGLIILAFRKWKNEPLMTFAVGWFLMGIFLSSNLLIPINALLYEHFLYLPLIGIFLIVLNQGFFLIQRFKLQSTALKIFFIYLIFLSALTAQRNRDWRDPITFYENLLKYAPTSYRVINNLGMVYADRGFHKKAEEIYRRAIRLDPTNPVGYHNIGGTYRDTGRIDLAIQSFKKAIELNPQFIFSYKSLAKLYLDKNDYVNARRVLEQYLRYTPEPLSTLLLLVQITQIQNDFSATRLYLKAALELSPANSSILSNLKKVEESLSILPNRIHISE